MFTQFQHLTYLWNVFLFLRASLQVSLQQLKDEVLHFKPTIWSFYFQDLKLDIMAFIGIIGMAGVVVNDSLMLFTTIFKLKEKYGVLSPEVIMEGAALRLRPIILTSITTLGGVFPMAYGIGGDAGFTKALAMSMGWGLLFATALTLFLIPSLTQVQEDIKSLTIKLLRKMKILKEDNVSEEVKIEDDSLQINPILVENKDDTKPVELQ